MKWLLFLAFSLITAPVLAAAPDREHQLVVRNGRLFMPATVNGKQIEVLLDSAAELSIIDDDFAKSLGLVLEGSEAVKGSAGEETVRFAKGVNIQAAKTELKDLMAAVLDLDDLSTRLVGSKVSAILGRDFFRCREV